MPDPIRTGRWVMRDGRTREPHPRPDHAPRRWPLLLAVGLVVALAGSAVYVVYFTSVLALRTVSVVGAGQSVEQQVRAQLAPQLGVPLAEVDTAAVQQALDGIPDIAATTVDRSWPNGLRVTVRQRVAVAVTKANDAWWSLDASGVPFAPTKVKPAKLMPIELATPGAQDPSTTAALSVVDSLPDSVSALVSSVRAASPYRIELLLADKRTVIWGDSSAGEQKAKVLPVMLQQPGSVFDLSDPTMVSVK